MPLPPAAPRKKFHHRAINCEGFAREDGLWDIEARITDTKTYAFDNEWRGPIEPGDPIHDMWIRLTMDDDRVIREVEAVMDSTPFEICSGAAPNFKALIGLKIAPGWNVAVRKRVGGTAGCTHMVELLAVMATVAYQTLGPGRKRRDEWLGRPPEDRAPSDNDIRPALLDSCHAWDRTGPVVKRFLPDFYEGEGNEKE
ncbi:MAG: DUF2889 domain-containing protein [Alphaproteobacteria bacterium]|nr:MAG: DUF2889 domain-containing protein [Alphaproteobacteria bacterium]